MTNSFDDEAPKSDKAIFKLPNDKEVELVRIVNTGMYGFRYVKGGQLPNDLIGMFTSTSAARNALDNYSSSYTATKKQA